MTIRSRHVGYSHVHLLLKMFTVNVDGATFRTVSVSGEASVDLAIEFDLVGYLRSRQDLVNLELERVVRPAYPERLYESMRYSLMSVLQSWFHGELWSVLDE